MKKILITGAGSYIGMSFDRWLRQWPDDYSVNTLDVVGDTWKDVSFCGYDALFHVAGIVHRKEKPGMENAYYDVNCRLAAVLAKKARNAGVGQFILMSTKGVYAPNTPVITSDTEPCPVKLYGRSKLLAENEIMLLDSDDFAVSVIRSPPVYGKGCPGNYATLSRLARSMPVFPYVENRRSMIYISNLCEFIKVTIDNRHTGVLFPQNKEFVCTMEIIRRVAEIHGRHVVFSRFLGRLVQLCMKRACSLKTVFGSSVYDKRLSVYDSFKYCKVDFIESVLETESS